MKGLIRAACIAAALAVAGPAAIDNAAAAPQVKIAGTSDASDFSAHRPVRRHSRHHGYYRPSYPPHYYDRPVYYRPYPYASPAPFIFGIGFGPSW